MLVVQIPNHFKKECPKFNAILVYGNYNCQRKKADFIFQRMKEASRIRADVREERKNIQKNKERKRIHQNKILLKKEFDI